MKLDCTVLKADVTGIEETFAVVDSNVGPILTAVLGQASDMAKKTFIIPKLNEAGNIGFPLPTMKHIEFTNTSLVLADNHVRISIDFAYRPPTLFLRDTNSLC